MSLLMQALKKAERARQSGLQADEVDDTAPDTHVPASPAPGGNPMELSLEPLEPLDPDEAPRPLPRPAPAPIEPASEAVHDPVPPQARHEVPRPAAPPVAPASASAEPPASERRPGRAGMDRRAAARMAGVRVQPAAGLDAARVRIVALVGVLVVMLAVFAYLYRQALTGPGPGASLPMVPMPPAGGTGANGNGGPAGIVVAPAPPAQAAVQAAPAPEMVPAAVVAAAAAEPAPVSAAPPPRRTARTPYRGPTAAQLAAIEDPEIRREAVRDAAERAMREQQLGAESAVPAAAAAAVAAPAFDSAPPSYGADSGDGVRVTRSTGRAVIAPGVQAGYAAFLAGDLATARQQYDTALRADANNRDALLGSAAVAAREGRQDAALAAYNRLLAQDPRDADALAGLTSLRPASGEQSEGRLRAAARTNPDAAPVHFALGNLYARQGRWQEAQQAYFRAWSAAPGNADYAFNLAVGLDRMNQGKLARDYYRRALALAGAAPVAFDSGAVQRRLQELDAAGAPAATPGN